MTLAKIITLAILQGVAEFLPISSSGHLVIAEHMMGVELEKVVSLNIVLHAGTLLSILVFYWRRVWKLVGEDRRVIGLLMVGTIPAVVIGLPLKKYGEFMLNSAMLAGCMLPLTGLLLMWSARRESQKQTYQEMTIKSALLVGLFQAIAILPGISRSGSTIVAGQIVGLSRQSAATFAFLLAIPAIAGATVLEIKDLLEEPAEHVSIGNLVIGASVSFAVGLLALSWLLRLIERGRLHWFAYWCIPVGVSVVIWQLVEMNG